MSFTKRERDLIDKASMLLESAESFGKDLHVFDFDETLAYPPNAIYKVYFGYYLQQGFQALIPDLASEGLDLLRQIGIEPLRAEVEEFEGSTTQALYFDHSGYDKLRKRVTKEWRNTVLAQQFPKDTSGHWPKSVSIKYEFPDPNKVLPEDYIALHGLEKMKKALRANSEVYICTAREGADNVKNIQMFLKAHQVNLPPYRIFAVGSAPKGIKVTELINIHEPISVYFYDDSSKNIASVRGMCCDLVSSLTLVKYSRNTPGEVESVEKCGTNVQKMNESRSNRNLFRSWRKLSGF